MSRAVWVPCCAAFALYVGLIPISAAAYETAAEHDPFGGVVEQELEPVASPPADSPPIDENSLLRNPNSPFALDPAPADEVPFPGGAAPAATGPQDLCRCVGGDIHAPSVLKIRQALRKPLKEAGFEFADQPLEEIAAMLREEYGIPIQLDLPALNELGISSDEPINVNLHDISLRSALRLMLKPKGLTYIIQDEVLLFTTPDEAEQRLEICVYDVRDLIDATRPAEVDSLVDTIVSCVATESWAKNGGGEAEIRTLKPGLLVVSQMQSVHDEIRELLETIRLTNSQAIAITAAPHSAAAPSVAAADEAKAVTRSYFLQINQRTGGDSFASQIRELITNSLPDEQWAGRLDNGEPVVLTVLPDRIVLRHREEVQDKVESLLKESAVAFPAPAVADDRGGGFGGGGGGGFFNPQSQPAGND